MVSRVPAKQSLKNCSALRLAKFQKTFSALCISGLSAALLKLCYPRPAGACARGVPPWNPRGCGVIRLAPLVLVRGGFHRGTPAGVGSFGWRRWCWCEGGSTVEPPWVRGHSVGAAGAGAKGVPPWNPCGCGVIRLAPLVLMRGVFHRGTLRVRGHAVVAAGASAKGVPPWNPCGSGSVRSQVLELVRGGAAVEPLQIWVCKSCTFETLLSLALRCPNPWDGFETLFFCKPRRPSLCGRPG